MISPAQARAARALLRWPLKEISHRAGVSVTTVTRFETELATPIPATRAMIQRAYEEAGIEFLGKDGVRLKG
jgi:transcriptional regulator with XRE-family HTH domain